MSKRKCGRSGCPNKADKRILGEVYDATKYICSECMNSLTDRVKQLPIESAPDTVKAVIHNFMLTGKGVNTMEEFRRLTS